ncbi:hypothetical protein PV04_00301 [Phialophora macrospora]|uniref:Uncharacterized protein n=1 Tax=Phialophora macrospora TaxID=1851006 RepID=A0A0D2G020_9EURO|nr:hypothetical protein PV04_00301 [Phialophora macrospora]
MVTWDNFKHNEQRPYWYTHLTEQNVFFYALIGPTQLQRYSDSSMLEQTHERQFAIGQLGTRNGDFEAHHIERMQSTFRELDKYFAAYRVEETCCPNSPHAEDLMSFRIQSDYFTPLPALDLEPRPRSTPSTPQPVVTPQKPSRSALDLHELMNPAPLPSSEPKSTLSEDGMPPIHADLKLGGEHEIDSDSGSNTMLPITYTRAKQVLREGGPARTRRGIRMRRARSIAKHCSREEPRDARQLEKDGQLLLSLSQRRQPKGHRHERPHEVYHLSGFDQP